MKNFRERLVQLSNNNQQKKILHLSGEGKKSSFQISAPTRTSVRISAVNESNH